MLANFISWVIVFFILFSFGDMLLALYNKICKRDEQYNIVGKLFLGLCSLSIPLSIWSLWLPSNQYFLYISIFASANYWVICKERAYCTYTEIRESTKGIFSPFQSTLIVAFVLFSLYFFTWEQDVYDSLFYHFQNIRWNEEYAVVPGLGNLDDKFGFNSNYFLLSSIFTFRFILGDAIYPLQPLIVTVIGCWVLQELFVSKYDIKRVVILFSYILLYWVSIYFLGNTSTDILPNFMAFYIIARLILNPKVLKSNYLFGITVHVFLLTCKLSFFPMGLISLYILYFVVKEKRYKIFAFLITISLFILVPWLIRNVILSGYLIYPIHQIDLFSFDWKVPREVAVGEMKYIFDVGYYFFRIAVRYPHMSIRDTLGINILTDVIYLLTLASFAIATYHIWKKRKKTSPQVYLLYSIFFITIIVWAKGGPDIRFVSGVLCAAILVGGIILFEKKELFRPVLSKITTCIFILSLGLWASSRYYNLYTETKEPKADLISHVLAKPYTVKDQELSRGIDVLKDFEPYPINNDQFIWVAPSLPYDMPPPATIHSHFVKFIPLDCIEARGFSVQDGYRVKDGCK